MRCTPQKTVTQVMAQSSHYLVAVKANQPKLLKQIKTQFAQGLIECVDHPVERCRDRTIHRTVSVMRSPNLDPQWPSIQCLIRVERSGTRANQPFCETMFYISSLACEAATLAQIIRHHWHIENRWHWVKDVVLQEDSAPLCDGHAIVNFAIVRTIILNLLRQHGFDSITQGIRQVAHDIPRLFSFLQ